MGAKWLYSNLSWASAAGTTLAFPPLLSEEGWRRSFRKVYSCREVVTIRKLQIFLKTLFYSIWLNVSMNSQPTRYFFFFSILKGGPFFLSPFLPPLTTLVLDLFISAFSSYSSLSLSLTSKASQMVLLLPLDELELQACGAVLIPYEFIKTG